MSEIANGGPAFPVFPETRGGHAGAFRGMTLRDYFAAKAMQGFMSATSDHSGTHVQDDDHLAERAYEMADAMLAAREAA